MRKATFFITLIAVLIFSGLRCAKEKALPPLPPYECDTTIISFQNDVQPLIETHCYVGGSAIGCHGSWILSWDGIADHEYFEEIELRVLIQRDMPPPGNRFDIPYMSYEELNKIYCWYQQGAQDN